MITSLKGFTVPLRWPGLAPGITTSTYVRGRRRGRSPGGSRWARVRASATAPNVGPGAHGQPKARRPLSCRDFRSMGLGGLEPPTSRLSGADWATSRPTYRPRRPTATPLYPVVQHHLETFLAQATESDPLGYGVPAWLEKDFRAYLRCGALAHGFARARCGDCGDERQIAFSCKGRGICPSCNTRRWPKWPPTSRITSCHTCPSDSGCCPYPSACAPTSTTTLTWPEPSCGSSCAPTERRFAPPARRTPGAQLGAVSFLLRFGSALNPHFHFHLVVLDGLFAQGPNGAVHFREAVQLDRPHCWTFSASFSAASSGTSERTAFSMRPTPKGRAG